MLISTCNLRQSHRKSRESLICISVLGRRTYIPIQVPLTGRVKSVEKLHDYLEKAIAGKHEKNIHRKTVRKEFFECSEFCFSYVRLFNTEEPQSCMLRVLFNEDAALLSINPHEKVTVLDVISASMKIFSIKDDYKSSATMYLHGTRLDNMREYLSIAAHRISQHWRYYFHHAHSWRLLVKPTKKDYLRYIGLNSQYDRALFTWADDFLDDVDHDNLMNLYNTEFANLRLIQLKQEQLLKSLMEIDHKMMMLSFNMKAKKQESQRLTLWNKIDLEDMDIS